MQRIEKTNVWRDARMVHLTNRERDVMSYLLRGAANKVIAAELGISQRTVEAHRAKLFRKMRVRNIVELVRMVCTPVESPHCLTTRQSASLVVHGELKRGNINPAPKAPLCCGAEAPAQRPECFTEPIETQQYMQKPFAVCAAQQD